MKLEDQVVSLELAKKLKELGFKQESYFYYKIRVLSEVNKKISITHGDIQKNRCGYEDSVSAYTVAELGEMLPAWFCIKKRTRKYEQWLSVNRLSHGWLIEYRDKKEKLYHMTVDKTEANARAKMLIYLKENKLI